MSEQDPAALVAEVRFYSAKARRVMEEINADPPQYVDYLDRLASSAEAALADRARAIKLLNGFVLNGHLLRVDEPFGGVLERLLDLAAAECAALAPDAKEEPTP